MELSAGLVDSVLAFLSGGFVFLLGMYAGRSTLIQDTERILDSVQVVCAHDCADFDDDEEGEADAPR